jgi:hypothetical protein
MDTTLCILKSKMIIEWTVYEYHYKCVLYSGAICGILRIVPFLLVDDSEGNWCVSNRNHKSSYFLSVSLLLAHVWCSLSITVLDCALESMVRGRLVDGSSYTKT